MNRSFLSAKWSKEKGRALRCKGMPEEIEIKGDFQWFALDLKEIQNHWLWNYKALG